SLLVKMDDAMTKSAKMEPAAAASAVAEAFDARRTALPGAGLPWLDAIRVGAMENFARDGFPSARVEEWKYADLNALAGTAFVPATPHANGIDARRAAALGPEGAPCHRITFVNGAFRSDLSDLAELPEGVMVTNLATALAERPDLVERHFLDPRGQEEARLSGRRDPRPFSLAALNAALAADGAVIDIAPGTVLERPLHLQYLALPGAAPEMIHARNMIVVGEGATATVLESYEALAPGVYWTNVVTQIAAGRGARLSYLKHQAEGRDAFHIAATYATLEKDAHLTSFLFASGALRARDELRIRMAGEGIECRLDGIYLARGRQNIDIWTRIDHECPHGTTVETYKGVVAGAASAAFQGKICVAEGAARTDARQLNRNLLLSDEARVTSKPELEILTDDVKCAHGSTVGDLDPAALFFLRSRGLDEAQARAMLVDAFIGAEIDAVADPALRGYFRAAAGAWFAKELGA
ncbi:MAG: Fe-S cluster assembly protein SufD, partial [Alphaproteobacteria bacterium]